MPRMSIPDVDKFLDAIGLLASKGFSVQTWDPDIIMVGQREIKVLFDAGLITLEQVPSGFQHLFQKEK